MLAAASLMLLAVTGLCAQASADSRPPPAAASVPAKELPRLRFGLGSGSPPAAGSPPPTTSAPGQPRIVPYQEGIRIDWTHQQIEVDARVILREGLIELFACSPQIREHESIVRIEARPLHLFQALGLIGLTPGHPVLYDDESGRRAPATGDPVEIEVRYAEAGQTRTVPIETWMQRSDGQPIERLQWVFAGSVELEDDSIAADYEGTVVAVVDFGSALVALPERHSNSNAELWLKPATAAIPPVGTPCTLIFRAGPVEIDLDADGRLHVGGRRTALAEAARRIRELAGREDPPQLRVSVDPACPESEVCALRHLLEGFGPALEVVERRNRSLDEPPTHESDALAAWLTFHLLPILEKSPTAETRPAAR